MSDTPTWTGKSDVNGRQINLGDIVQHHNESKNTKPEYWNPIYKVIWNAPCFELVHVGGGKSCSDMTFTLRHYPNTLEVVSSETTTPTREQIIADERVQALVEAANGVTAFVGYSAHVPEKLDRLYAALDAFKESP